MNNILITLLLLFGTSNILAQEIGVTEQSGIESEITVAVNPKDDNQVIIASMGENSPIIIYTSIDSGANWKQTSFGSGIADPVLTYGDNNTAYLTFLDFGNTLEMTLAQSTDNGLTWEEEVLALDGLAADRQWIKRDNSSSSPHYRNIYISYFHPEEGADIHVVKIDSMGTVDTNHPIHSTTYDYVQNPAMDITNSGKVVICFIVEEGNGTRKIVAVHSIDGTATFSNEFTISNLHMFENGIPITDVVGFAPGDASRIGHSLQMAIDKSNGPYSDRAYLTWTDFKENNPEEGLDIYLSYSDDEGITWSTPKIVNDDNIPSSHQYYSGIDVNPDGILCMSWYDRRNDPLNDAMTDFFFTYSKDGGKTFQKSVKVNSASADHREVTNGLVTFGVGEYTSIASTQTDAYLVWSDGRENNGDMDVYFAKASLDEITSVTETQLAQKLQIDDLFPNPVTNGRLSISLNSLSNEEIEIFILNDNGQVLKQDKLFVEKGSLNSFSIELPTLPAGNYFLKINHIDGTLTRKFIVSE